MKSGNPEQLSHILLSFVIVPKKHNWQIYYSTYYIVIWRRLVKSQPRGHRSISYIWFMQWSNRVCSPVKLSWSVDYQGQSYRKYIAYFYIQHKYHPFEPCSLIVSKSNCLLIFQKFLFFHGSLYLANILF